LIANFYALFTPDPAETLRYLKRHPLVLQDRVETGLPQIERFLDPPKSVVVRVWHDAEVLARNGTPCVLAANGLWLLCGDGLGGSHITLTSTPSFDRALVVIDSTRIQGFQLGQISAYVAIVGLLDVDGDVNLGDTPSILRLFADSPEERAEGITEWDRAFLTALYHTGQWNAQQRKQIANKMVDEIGPARLQEIPPAVVPALSVWRRRLLFHIWPRLAGSEIVPVARSSLLTMSICSCTAQQHACRRVR
jgi:hypothetical protein